jgi:hypothetical protein
MKRLALIAAFAVVLVGAAPGMAHADAFTDGQQAFQNEQYAGALDLLTPYAKDGNVEAAFLLGEMYGPRSWGQKGENRNGVEQDDKQAIYWWTQAAKAGHAQAQLKLGWWLMNGKGVVEVDEKQGMDWLVKSAEQGDPHAQFEAGMGFWKGKGVSQDLMQAYVWLSLASTKDGFEPAVGHMREIEKSLTAAQLVEARRLSKEWKPK